jgi:uncharacterized membrane protein YvbJ
LVYCTKCGTKNEDDATECTKCGATLHASRPAKRHRTDDTCFGPYEHRPTEDECFGLPHGGAIVGIIFGIIIIIIGLSIYSGLQLWEFLGPAMLVIVGLLIVIGAFYGMRRR